MYGDAITLRLLAPAGTTAGHDLSLIVNLDAGRPLLDWQLAALARALVPRLQGNPA